MNGRRGMPSLPTVGVQAWPPVQSESMLQWRGPPKGAPGGTQKPSAGSHPPAPSPRAAQYDVEGEQVALVWQWATQAEAPPLPTQNVVPVQQAPATHRCPLGQKPLGTLGLHGETQRPPMQDWPTGH